mmetsp:Transcript_4580/g.7859  ORF Transcript_4580/g.7859 Transcript_4580/m.7859 type:complete len:504 (-) Transcript_4580:206-1717(-)|eukprot:CAMPEP_0197074874 /NCGR_PEP_ID=MMETSP1384-20130603/211326_1 /TAXON_ID=29189 /ORGANISM="Ammonia sp." /LENGTH=503 /DNA_ID=CAMNT_0042513715 /DNA_START=154 /DNA_END=1665 /DNA_ORIENTATION=+
MNWIGLIFLFLALLGAIVVYLRSVKTAQRPKSPSTADNNEAEATNTKQPQKEKKEEKAPVAPSPKPTNIEKAEPKPEPKPKPVVPLAMFAHLNTKKIDKTEFVKTSAQKKEHYNKFPTLQDYATGKQAVAPKVSQLTTEILQEKPSGDPSNRDTLLHVLHGAASMGGKACFFYDSSKGINPTSTADQDSYLNAVDADDETAPKFVLKLRNLDGFTNDDDDEKHDTNEDLADKVKTLKEALQSDAHHPVIEQIRARLAKAYNVNVDRIVITDFYVNGFAAPHYIRDLTDNEKNKIVTQASQLNKKMDQLFPNYDSCAIHPALFHHTYDVSMFDERGNKTFGDSDNKTYKVGPPGRERDYIQPTGWTRYGLKVLGKYGDDKWLHPFRDAGNWYRAYHGTDREAGSSIYKGAFRPGAHNAYGVGVYCTPDVKIAAGYCKSRGGIIELDTKQGRKKFYFVFQVAVNPDTMNNAALIPNFNPACESVNYWIAPSGADIRPYGILIKEV